MKYPNEKYACGDGLHALDVSGAPLATGLAREPGPPPHPGIAAGPAPPIIQEKKKIMFNSSFVSAK